MSKRAKAIFSDWLTCCGLSYGLMVSTPSIVSTSARNDVMASFRPGVFRPSSLLKTTVAEKPALLGFAFSRSSCTSRDSLFGKTKSVRKLPFIAPDAAATMKKRGIQIPNTTMRRRRTQNRASDLNMGGLSNKISSQVMGLGISVCTNARRKRTCVASETP